MPELRTVKLIVGGMTVILVGMVGAVLWKLSQPMADTLPLSPSSSWEYNLPEGKIESITQAGAFLAIMAKTDHGTVVYVVNPVTHKLVGTVKGAN